MLFLLFIMFSLIRLVHSEINLPINLFLQIHFYSLNIDLVYTACHIRMHRYLDSTYTLYCNSLCLQNLHYNRMYKYHYSKFVYYCILTNLIGTCFYNFRATIHYEFHLTSLKNCNFHIYSVDDIRNAQFCHRVIERISTYTTFIY